MTVDRVLAGLVVVRPWQRKGCGAVEAGRQRRIVFCVVGLVLSVDLGEPAPISSDTSRIETPPPASTDLGTLEIGPLSTTAPDLLPPDRNRSEWEVTVSDGQWSLRSVASQDLIVADRLGNDVTVHDLPDDGAEWTVQSVFIDDGRMVLSEHGHIHGGYRVWVHELDSGEGRAFRAGLRCRSRADADGCSNGLGMVSPAIVSDRLAVRVDG